MMPNQIEQFPRKVGSVGSSTKKPRVFISYAREDAEIARRVYDDLESADLQPWIDTVDLFPGERWELGIRNAMRGCDFFLALLSKNSISKRGYIQKELREALLLLEKFPLDEIFVIPVRLEECYPNDQALKELNWVDLFSSYEKGIERIIKTLTLMDAPVEMQVPDGWLLAGSNPEYYEIGIDKKSSQRGNASAYISSARTTSEGFGTLMQVFKADKFRGKRLRMTAYVRVDDVEAWAGMWMRVDGPEFESLSFDNMQNRPIHGTTNWQRYEVVLDVPGESVKIAFGILLAGGGRVNLANVGFEEVDQSVPVTDLPQEEYPAEPLNLDFESNSEGGELQ
jgi:hypothetical protein